MAHCLMAFVAHANELSLDLTMLIDIIDGQCQVWSVSQMIDMVHEIGWLIDPLVLADHAFVMIKFHHLTTFIFPVC